MAQWRNKRIVLQDIAEVTHGFVPVNIDHSITTTNRPPVNVIQEEIESELLMHCSGNVNFAQGPDLSSIRNMIDMIKEDPVEEPDVGNEDEEIIKRHSLQINKPVIGRFVSKVGNTTLQDADAKARKRENEKRPKGKSNNISSNEYKAATAIHENNKHSKRNTHKPSRNAAMNSIIANKLPVNVQANIILLKPTDFMNDVNENFLKLQKVKSSMRKENKLYEKSSPILQSSHKNLTVEHVLTKNDDEVNKPNNSVFRSGKMSKRVKPKSTIPEYIPVLKPTDENLTVEPNPLQTDVKVSEVVSPTNSFLSGSMFKRRVKQKPMDPDLPKESPKVKINDKKFVPSAASHEQYKIYLARSEMKSQVVETVWTRAEKQMKEIDERRRIEKELAEAAAAAAKAAAAEAVNEQSTTDGIDSVETTLKMQTVQTETLNDVQNVEIDSVLAETEELRSSVDGVPAGADILDLKKAFEDSEINDQASDIVGDVMPWGASRSILADSSEKATRGVLVGYPLAVCLPQNCHLLTGKCVVCATLCVQDENAERTVKLIKIDNVCD